MKSGGGVAVNKKNNLEKFINELIDEIEEQEDIIMGEFSTNFEEDRKKSAAKIEKLRKEAESLLTSDA